jgi:hypothetical protein
MDMDTVSGRRGRGVLVGLGLALALGVAGLMTPMPAGAQALGPGRGYHSVPAPQHRRDDRHFRRDGWRHDRFRRDDWRHDRFRRHDGYRFRPYRPYYAPVVPYPAYRPGQWLWNGWGWIWVPGY